VANSQNGWSVGTSGQLGVVPLVVAGIAFPPGVRGGDVATVLGYVAQQFHNRVEHLYTPGCWGYAFRPVAGQTTGYSNHASGTAIDINAPTHPLAKVGTFTPQQAAEIRRIVAEVAPAVRWGGDYSGRKDEMHFEINASAATVAAVAARIRGGGAPAPTPPSGGGVAAPPFPLPGGYYFGPRSGPNNSISCMARNGSDARWRPNLRQWQQRMIDRGWGSYFRRYGADGMYGETVASSEAGQCALAFQREKGLAADGLIGPQTWAAAWTAPIT